jgi:hypothetical protein
MKTNFLLSAAFLLSLAATSVAQPGALLQNTLTNHDIVVLAQAGFNENFIADFIAMSRTRFDTSVTGLADMAKEGLTERLIRVMLTASTTPPSGSAPGAMAVSPAGAAATAADIVPATMFGPPREANRRRRDTRQPESNMAIASQAPYYRASSIFWGFWKTKTGVGVGMRTAEQPVSVSLGAAYGQVLMSPTGVPARYVVIP